MGSFLSSCFPAPNNVAVIPVLVGPLQALIAILPGLLVALGTALLALFKLSTMKKLVLLLWSSPPTMLASRNPPVLKTTYATRP